MTEPLNLMPTQALHRRATAQAVRTWACVLALGVVVALGLGVVKLWQREGARQQVAALRAQHEPVQQLRRDLGLLRARIASLQKHERLALAITGAPPLLSVLAAVTEASENAAGQAYVQRVEFEADPLADRSNPPVLIIDAVTRDPDAVGRFVASLEASPCFTDVRLGESQAQLLRGLATTAFTIECSL